MLAFESPGEVCRTPVLLTDAIRFGVSNLTMGPPPPAARHHIAIPAAHPSGAPGQTGGHSTGARPPRFELAARRT